MPNLSITNFIANPINGQTLAPMGSNLAIAEWTAQALHLQTNLY